ncbi:MAG: hypothetical protein ACLRXQ_05400 [Phascolarctobacterium faecium]
MMLSSGAKKKEIEGTGRLCRSKIYCRMLQDEGQRTRIGAKPTVILVVASMVLVKIIGKLANYFHLFK